MTVKAASPLGLLRLHDEAVDLTPAQFEAGIRSTGRVETRESGAEQLAVALNDRERDTLMAIEQLHCALANDGNLIVGLDRRTECADLDLERAPANGNAGRGGYSLSGCHRSSRDRCSREWR